ncbi:preprotein translocase subunit SecG, partial [Dysosmobacter welbionis]
VLCGLAVGAAIGVSGGIAQQEYGVQLRLRHSDAAGVFAVDDIHQLFRKLQMLLFHPHAVADDVDGDVGVDIAQHIQIYLHR